LPNDNELLLENDQSGMLVFMLLM